MIEFLHLLLAETPKITPNEVGFPSVSLGAGVRGIINFLLYVAGILSVLFIAVGALFYTTSAGDPARINKAKDTLLYAIIGLIVSISAYTIIAFITGRL